jgi:hypothetical protein
MGSSNRRNREKKTPAAAVETTENGLVDTENGLVDIENGLVDIEVVNLRTAGPVTRLRGVMAQVTSKITFVQGKLTSWGDSNEQAKELADAAEQLNSEVSTLVEGLEKLEGTGFSPPRKSFTALTTVGDRVSILEKYRERYEDLLHRDQMDDLTVIKKRDGRGGGLILEARDGTKVPAASAHIVRLSKPKAV